MLIDNPRIIALDLLIKSEKKTQYSNIALDKVLDASDLSTEDRRLATVLFYGVTEKKLTLDYQIEALSDRPPNTLDPKVLNAIRLGIYQLAFMNRIPAHAAINETVSLCPRKTAGFVNAVLRAYTRNVPRPLPDKHALPTDYLSIAYSVCAPLCRKLVETYGFEKTESFLKAISVPPPTAIRVNTLQLSRSELASQIKGAIPTALSPHGLLVTGTVRKLYGFNEGAFFVQDEASQLCVEALDAKEGMTVIDMCACPGSKSFGAAINMKNKGTVLAFDLHEKKLPLIQSGAERLKLDIIRAAVQDGKLPVPTLFNSADRVLCDVPCSGFGVLAKKPELRYKDPSISSALPTVQAEILENACNYVKEGGILVYSTCTVFPEENEENIHAFLERHSDFGLMPFSVGNFDCPKGYITLLPDEYGTDGFFIAKLVRRSNR